MTKKKRLTISFNYNDLRIIKEIMKKVDTKQISKAISYCIQFTYLNDKLN